MRLAALPAPPENVGFSKSTDNGATFAAAANLAPATFTMDQCFGNDRNNTSPSMAVDTSAAPQREIYITYRQRHPRRRDVVIQTSSNQGASFHGAAEDQQPRRQRQAQWFPGCR
jgi:hypothetical protein